MSKRIKLASAASFPALLTRGLPGVSADGDQQRAISWVLAHIEGFLICGSCVWGRSWVLGGSVPADVRLMEEAVDCLELRALLESVSM